MKYEGQSEITEACPITHLLSVLEDKTIFIRKINLSFTQQVFSLMKLFANILLLGNNKTLVK